MLGKQLLVLLFSLVAVLGLTVEFDVAQEGNCLKENGGCSFDSDAIWIGNVPPTANDTVVITATGTTTSPVLIYINSTATFILSLSMQNASFLINSNSSLVATTVTIGDLSTLTLADGGSLHGNGVFTLTPTASLEVEGSGTISWIEEIFLYGTISTSPTNILHWTNVTYVSQTKTISSRVMALFFTVAADVSVTFAQGAEMKYLIAGANAYVTISGEFSGQLSIVGTVDFTDATATIESTGNDAINGTGQIYIADSTVVIANNQTGVFAGNVSVSGTSTVSFKSISVSKLDVDMTADATITGDGFILEGDSTLYGTLTAIGSGVNITGNTTVSVAGTLALNNTKLYISSDATVLFFDGTNFTIIDSTILLGGLIFGDVHIPSGSSLTSVARNAAILGNVDNNGVMRLSSSNALVIEGTFSQTPIGKLEAGISSDSDPALIVNNATASISGYLQYTVAKKPLFKSVKFLVVRTNQNLTGTFNGSATALKGSALERTLAIQYDSSNVYIKYSLAVDDVESWMWVVGAVVVAVLVVATIAVVVKCRKRSEYEPVR